MTVVVLVGLIVLGMGLIQAAIWIPLVRRWCRRSAAFLAGFQADASASGERILIPPEKGVYRGCTAHYGAVTGNGTMILTDRRLMFRKLTGGLVEVPAGRIAGTHESASFLSSRVAGATHLVVSTTDPAELGFFVQDLAAWEAALAGLRTQ